MFTGNKRDETKYCEFHEDHGYDTNDCIDLRKEIETCIRNGRMAHLAKGTKIHNSNQNNKVLGFKDNHNPRIEWNRKMEADDKPKNEIHMIRKAFEESSSYKTPSPNITFFWQRSDPETLH